VIRKNLRELVLVQKHIRLSICKGNFSVIGEDFEHFKEWSFIIRENKQININCHGRIRKPRENGGYLMFRTHFSILY
jgi:hypothetical protein